MERKIKILKGRAKSFDIYIQDESGNPKDITGHSLIRMRINHNKGVLTKYAPLSPGVNEQQDINLDDPDAGSFSLKYGDEETALMPFNVAAGTIQTNLNAFNELSGVVVTDQGSGVFEVSFDGNDGSRAHDLIQVTNSTLTTGGDAAQVEVTEAQEGQAPNGIDVVEEKCGHLKIKLSEEDVDLLDVRNDQDIDLYVRIGTEDLDLDPLLFRGVLDVSDPDC